MSDHRFKIGENLRVNRSFPDRTSHGTYEIVRLLPKSTDGEPQYRIRGSDNIERAVGEQQLVKLHPA